MTHLTGTFAGLLRPLSQHGILVCSIRRASDVPACSDMAWFTEGKALGDWTLGPLLTTPDGVEVQHVRFAERSDGRRGVVKIIRGGKGGIGRVRLENEIGIMQRLNGTQGVLPVLDSSTQDRAFLITPAVQTLREHFGVEPNLREVVDAIADLADTLAALQTQGTYHRDLKPENLFWDGHGALLGDFGLVLDPDATHTSVTVDGDMLGSIYFMAPEARVTSSRTDWGLADVYSLAMCLWVLARGAQWPPHSTLWGRQRDVSLYYEGGTAADDLVALLQMATESSPRDRLSVYDFATELRTWLRLHPTTTRVKRPPVGDLWGNQMEARAALGGMDGLAERCLNKLARDVIDRLPAGWGEVKGQEMPGKILEAPDITHGNPDWAREWGPVTVAREFEDVSNIRLVVELVGDSEETGYYFAEWQRRDDATWQVSWFLPEPPAVRPRFPSDRELCKEELAPAIVAHAPIIR
jgi:serine/threonine protein kinase